nr:molybdopterin-guanine dinucleotide biosynthesis protein B [uncultured Clostridium sp.]
MSLKKDGLKKVPKIINIVASCSNSGKTTLIEGIIKELKKEECIISTIKHDVHGFDIDKKGKDTYRHRMAGADNISISSKNRFAMISELTDELNLEEILEKHKMSDYIIVEGYKNSSLKKIEVFRKGFSDKIITPLENLIAIATDDESLDSLAKKVDINDYKAIVEIINDSY